MDGEWSRQQVDPAHAAVVSGHPRPMAFPWPHPYAGRLDEQVIDSPALVGNPLGDPHERPLWVYLPPGYDDDSGRRYYCYLPFFPGVVRALRDSYGRVPPQRAEHERDTGDRWDRWDRWDRRAEAPRSLVRPRPRPRCRPEYVGQARWWDAEGLEANGWDSRRMAGAPRPARRRGGTSPCGRPRRSRR